MHFTDIFVKRPVLATVVSLLILLAGLQAILQLPIRQFPEVSDTKIEITTVYPGANADQIKGFITTPLQQAVASTEGVDIIESRSSQNISTITLKLRLDANADRALADVLSKVNEVKGVLPEEANDPVVKRTTGAGFALMYISFKSDQMSAPQISDYLDRVVKPKLQAINGVASAEILGGSTFAMRVWLDPEKMASLGITPLDVRRALAANNFSTAAGEVKSDFTQQNINAQTSLETPEQFAQLVVATRGETQDGICSTAFLEYAFRTDSYTMNLTFHDEDSWSYDIKTMLLVHGRDELFEHHDTNTLRRVGPAKPNPLMQILTHKAKHVPSRDG